MTTVLSETTENGEAGKAATATTPGGRRLAYNGPAIFSQGFRPFFLAAGVLAVVALPLWMLQFLGAVTLPGVPDPLAWHIHEMLFGYLSAALAGFLLTAIPNWTGRLPIAGRALMALFGLWLAGRTAMLLDAGGAAGIAVALAFLVALSAVVWREVIAAGNHRNLPICLLVTTLAAAQAVFLIGEVALGMRIGFATAAMMILLVGGRIIPSFTTNWLKKQQATSLPAPFGSYDKIALGISLVALVCWVALPEAAVTGAGFTIAAAANLWRLARWRGPATLREPLLLVLHIAFAWLPLAFALFALSILAPDHVSGQQALHALGAGGIGMMTLAVMTRAALGHSGQALQAGAATSAAYVLVFLGAAARVAADWTTEPTAILHLGAASWTIGFLIFVLRFTPILAIRRS
ncbi:NnrS family protein [Pelagibius litoralis]|uniref:NnrS family protein n=1 Tax=Pelagibius litoralis TaxID=374515 RepID=A0A967KAU7_9PROT|nr:NnrS family protein [Pelagibius litoralis]NIA71833.1 NnrS family protein [Pelagibius litoralis]